MTNTVDLQLPDKWIPLEEAALWCVQRLMVNGSDYLPAHWACKYVNIRVDLRTGHSRISPGNLHRSQPMPLRELSPDDPVAEERVATVLGVFSALKTKTPQELTELVLGELHKLNLNSTQELLLEEVCDRLYPNWSKELPKEVTNK